MTGNSGRDVELFTEAIQLPDEERLAFLHRACAQDEELRLRIEALLRSNDRAGEFMEMPPTRSLHEVRAKMRAGEKPGDRVGRYKLLRQIGEGGCGIVFVAEQEEPVRRRVALKVIKPGMDTKSVIARFEAERQALALMDHANIAHVFDAGTTESGRPYFVMELVEGVKISDYCDQHPLSLSDRLELFVQVCDAIQHAHQKGIIHRDIKPSNVLVTSEPGGKPVPKVIDFGIAKATTSQQLADKTIFTAHEMLIGTPAYMSPEQAALASAEVDTRTDIYSLGVLLYELLTGKTPFDTRELLKAGFDEVRRVIRDEEPVRPSTRLTTMTAADLASVSKHHGAEAPKLIREMRGDLDWIVMKALEKDPARRYATAYGLATDIKRYLACEAIVARPPSNLYRFQKIFGRNKSLFTGIGVIALLLLVSLISVSTLLGRERQARRNSDRDKRKAQQVTTFLEDMLQSVGPSVALGRDTTMLREILDRTASGVGMEMTNQPSVEAELHGLIGRVYYEIGNYAKAEEMHRAALAINRKLFGPGSKEAAISFNDLGVALWKEGKLAEAEASDKEALLIRRRLFGEENEEVATSLSNLADVYRHQGKVEEAVTLTQEALGIRQKLFGTQSLKAADSLRSLCILLGDEGKRVESEATAREVLAIRRQQLGPDDPLVASSLDDLAWAMGYLGKLHEAESLEREALAIRQKVLGNEHPQVARSLYLLGDRLREEGNLKQSYSFLSVALSIQSKLLGYENPASLDTLRSLGLTLAEQGDLAEAETVDRKALALWRKQSEGDTPQALSVLGDLVHLFLRENELGKAEQLLNEALTPAFVVKPASTDFLDLAFNLEARRGRWQAAADHAALAFEHRPLESRRYPPLASLFIRAHDLPAYEEFRTRLLYMSGSNSDFCDAHQVAKACLFVPPSNDDLPLIARLADMAVRHGINDKAALPFFQACKALSEYRQGQFVEAAQWAQKSIESPRLDSQALAYPVLAMACWQLGEKDKARAMLAKGNALAPHGADATDLGEEWEKWLFGRIYLDEAEELINPTSAAASQSNSEQ